MKKLFLKEPFLLVYVLYAAVIIIYVFSQIICK